MDATQAGERPADSASFDAALIRRYDRSGPRYTSYPTAVQFHAGFSAADYRRETVRQRQANPSGPLSLYVHLPFCATVCYYCACNKIVTNNRAHAGPYLERLEREITLQAELFPPAREIVQLHWGGGTPTFLGEREMAGLMTSLRDRFTFAAPGTGEYSIEIDPRESRPHTLHTLAALGFNRVSLGVQDFDPQVQRAVNRIQSEAVTLGAIEAARNAGFRSVSVDLIYGLPRQTRATFARTIERIVGISPDRIAVYNYAHLPGRFKTQRQIRTAELPSAADKLATLGDTTARLTAAGYCYIGMDHFARPDDELAVAQRERKLQRNFQGYSTHGECDLVALGLTGIGQVGNCYYQNAATLDDYYAGIDADQLPICRGIELSADDRLRRALIAELICHFALDFGAFERRFGIEFPSYFASEIARLREMEGDGLLELDPRGIRVLDPGRMLIRSICMVFDRYLDDEPGRNTYSKVI